MPADKSTCSCCNIRFERYVRKLKCTTCDSLYHNSCVINAPVTTYGGFTWCCGKTTASRCSTSLTPRRRDVIKPISQADLDAFFVKMENMFSGLFQKYTNEVTQKLDTIDKKISTLENRVIKLEAAQSLQPSPILVPDVLPISDKESLLNELEKRRKNALNVIIYNFAENPNPTHDLVNFNNILNQLESGCTAVSATRIGISVRGKPKPLKLTFRSEFDALQVFRLKLNLASRNIQVVRDLTLEQRRFLSELRVELNRRIESGEPNLTIKYVDGVPKIVSKND